MDRKKRARRCRAAACVSAVLALATLAIAAWGWHRYVRLGVTIGRPIELHTGSGLIALDNFDKAAGLQITPDPGASLLWWPPMLSNGRRWAIWEPDTRADGTPYTHWYIRTPAWIPALIFGVAAVLCERRARRLNAITAGRCEKCGYDLTGLKTGRCPECGVGTG